MVESANFAQTREITLLRINMRIPVHKQSKTQNKTEPDFYCCLAKAVMVAIKYFNFLFSTFP